MPELPEVETTVRALRPALVGRVITGVHLGWPRHSPHPADLVALLPGRLVDEISRRGKYIVVHLWPADRLLLVHLGMSGRLAVCSPEEPPDRHAHTIFTLDDRNELRFSDPRKFGRVLLVADPAAVLGALGPEPLSEEFTPGWLAEKLSGRRRAIKPLIMEQRFIAGLGNIYTDEALHRARVAPIRPAQSLSPAEVEALHSGIQSVLAEAIEYQGTSFDWVYRNGEMQERLSVYGRSGQPCPICGAPVERIVLAQRGTHFCPRCQS